MGTNKTLFHHAVPVFSFTILFSDFSLRASMGTTGNTSIDPYQTQGGLARTTYSFGGDGAFGYRPDDIANPDLSWEKTAQFNIGLDAGFFRDAIGVELNYYDKYTTDAILEIPVPGYTGFGTYLTNFGVISNRGFEVTLNSVNVNRKDFSWKTSFNVARNINRIEVLPSPITYERFSRIEEGVALYSYWLYNVQGVDPQSGDLIIEDVTGDGQITTDDRKVIGDAWPDYFGGITNSFTYKNFDVNLLFTFSYGNYLWNHNRALSEHGGRLDQSRALSASQLNRWQKPGDVTDVPRLTLDNYSKQELSRFFEDASFLRLRSLTVGYTLPIAFSTKYSIEKLRIYFTGSNLFLATGYSGADPETRIERGQNQNIQGYDFASPPTPRTIQFGINLTL